MELPRGMIDWLDTLTPEKAAGFRQNLEQVLASVDEDPGAARRAQLAAAAVDGPEAEREAARADLSTALMHRVALAIDAALLDRDPQPADLLSEGAVALMSHVRRADLRGYDDAAFRRELDAVLRARLHARRAEREAEEREDRARTEQHWASMVERVRAMRRALADELGRAPTLDELAEHTGMPRKPLEVLLGAEPRLESSRRDR